MRQAIEADPNTRPGAMKRVDALLADPEGALKRLQSIRNQRKGAPKK